MKYIQIVGSDVFIETAASFVLMYDIPLDWDVYRGVEDGSKKFVAVAGPYARKYDEDDWEYLGQAGILADEANTEKLTIDDSLVNNKLSDDQWDAWEKQGINAPTIWGIHNGSPAVVRPGDMFNRYLFTPLFLGKLELAWESMFPMLSKRLLDEMGFVLSNPSTLTRYYRVLGGEVFVCLRLDRDGFTHFIQSDKETYEFFDWESNLESALDPDNTSVETRESLIQFVVSVSERILDWIVELNCV